MDIKAVKQQLVPSLLVSLLTALIIVIGAAIVEYFRDGALIKHLGGVSRPEMENATLAFFRNECPSGWEETAQGRIIVGVGSHDGNEYSLGDTGGSASIQLTKDTMPEHEHDYKDIYHAEDPDHLDQAKREQERRHQEIQEKTTMIPVLGGVGSKSLDFDNEGWARETKTGHSGGGESVDNMPPYIVLRYCKLKG